MDGMKTIVIPYGKEGWKARHSLTEEIIASRKAAPYIYNDVLIIVPSARMHRTYGRLFIDAARRIHNAPSIVPPQVLTLYQFFEDLSPRLSKGIIDETSRLVLLEGIIKEILIERPPAPLPLDILAPSLSAMAAEMIEQLCKAGVEPSRLEAWVSDSEISDKPAALILTKAYKRYEASLERLGLLDPHRVPQMISKDFDPSWLAPYSRIIIDGISKIELHEAGVIRRLLETTDCMLLIEAPSDELIERAGVFHPLSRTREFLTDINAPRPHRVIKTHPDDLLIGEILFSDKPFAESVKKALAFSGSFSKNIMLLSAVNPREEVRLIAGEVKKSLRAGAKAERILVAFPSLDEYTGLVEEIFSDYGIPYNRALGRQLSTSPVTNALISCLLVLQEDFSGRSILRVFSSPFLKFSEMQWLVGALDDFMRKERITSGRSKWLHAIKRDGQDMPWQHTIHAPLMDLFDALEPFRIEQPLTLHEWCTRLDQLASWSGLWERVQAVPGALNVNLQAYKRFTEAVSSLATAGKRFPELKLTFGEWFYLLRRIFMRTRFQVPAEDEAGVQVLGIMEGIGRPWDEVYLGGLCDGKFPPRLPQNIFLPDSALEKFNIRPFDHARLDAMHHFYRLLMSADRVTLTHPESEEGRPVVPSPFIEEMAPLLEAGLANRSAAAASQIQFSLRAEDSMSVPDLAKAVGLLLHCKRSSDPELARLLDSPDLSVLKQAASFVPQTGTAAAPQVKGSYKITELDLYLSCPYAYYASHVLQLAPVEEITEDISAAERGDKVHGILKEFYVKWHGPITAENRAEAKRLLLELAERAFAGSAPTFRNMREKEMSVRRMAERFLDAEVAFWKQGMRPAFLEANLTPYPIELDNGTVIELHGTVDRIDVDDNGNFIIVDYKTGRYPEPKTGPEQEIFQLPVYAVMARGRLNTERGQTPLLQKPIGLAYYDLMGKVSPSARDVVLFNKDVRNDHPSAKPRTSPRLSEDFEAVLSASMEKAKKAVEGIIAGVFPASPYDDNRCGSCPYTDICSRMSQTEQLSNGQQTRFME